MSAAQGAVSDDDFGFDKLNAVDCLIDPDISSVDQDRNSTGIESTIAKHTGLQPIDRAVVVAVGKQEVARVERRGTASGTDGRGLLDQRDALYLDAQILAIDQLDKRAA